MYHHRYTYRPEAERRQADTENRFGFIFAVLVFGIIGCLLAWRG